jgi:hypothetical protein
VELYGQIAAPQRQVGPIVQIHVNMLQRRHSNVG